MTQIALTIAGSDSGGGAGIQADLRTFAFHGVHGASVITCVTAQNTVGVTKVEAISLATISAQIEAVKSDLQVNAVKTGMLLQPEVIEAIASCDFNNLVVDPVMVSRAGVRLIDDAAIATLQECLLPQAAIVTPNRYEAEILSGLSINSLADLKQASQAIYDRWGKIVLAKGGSLSGKERGSDVWYDGRQLRVLEQTAIDTKNTHGTGCTLSAAICANLALEKDLWSAVIEAKQYVTTALQYSLDIGAGSGPVGHFFPLITKR
jgi:hydroxymethylpyrimidine/phosphomethylpyrimidine kinase